jgi:hypothetical protein
MVIADWPDTRARDPVEARAIIDPALRLMVDAVRRYEGFV